MGGNLALDDRGCLEWRRDGLKVPAIVRAASDAYFAEQDVLGQWLDECTFEDADAFTRTRDLFDNWRKWCEEKNLSAGSEKTLSETLVNRGFAKIRHSRTRQFGFRGLDLQTNGPNWETMESVRNGPLRKGAKVYPGITRISARTLTGDMRKPFRTSRPPIESTRADACLKAARAYRRGSPGRAL
jgi:hypothetical protein